VPQVNTAVETTLPSKTVREGLLDLAPRRPQIWPRDHAEPVWGRLRRRDERGDQGGTKLPLGRL